MDLLILGGTGFIGVHMTQLALARGHTVTHFNRGRTNADLFPHVERLTGDRNGPLDALRARRWDAVIDNCGFLPRQVRLSAELLASNVQQYVFVSSLAVYSSFATPPTESSPVTKLADESIQQMDLSIYGPLKAACEDAAEAAMPGRVTVLRPGLIVGPGDNTERFTYWPVRTARGGDFVAPGSPIDGIQIIDARDLATFALHSIEQRVVGPFNVVSAAGELSMGDLIDESIRTAEALAKPSAPPRPTWIPAEFLRTQQVALFEFPVWVDAAGPMAGFSKTSAARAFKAGLTIRPLRTTVHDTLDWHLRRPEAQRTQFKGGVAPAREQQLLAAWRESQAGAAN
jgi:2'-hydroxyisoflavone reductase